MPVKKEKNLSLIAHYHHGGDCCMGNHCSLFYFIYLFFRKCKDVTSGLTYESVWANRLFFSTLFLKYAQLPLSKEVIARMFLLSLFLSLSESRADPMLLRFRGDWTWCNFRVSVSGSLHVDVCAREICDGVNGADATEPQ